MNVCNILFRLRQSHTKLSPSGSQLEKSKMKRMTLAIGIGRTGILIQSSTASNSCSGCRLIENVVLSVLYITFLFLDCVLQYLRMTEYIGCHPDGRPCDYYTINHCL